MGINPNQISIIDDTGSSAQEGSLILSKNNGDNLWTSNSTASIIIPVGNTAQQDSASIVGRLRFNTDKLSPEMSANGNWKSVSQLSDPGTSVAPGIAFSNDSLTGLYREQVSGSSYLGINVAGAKTIYLASNQSNFNTPVVSSGTMTSTGSVFAAYPGNTVGLSVTIPNAASATLVYNVTGQYWISNTRMKVPTPIDNDDVATKFYVDNALSGGTQATVTSYGTVKLATLSQMLGNGTGVGLVPTADVVRSAFNQSGGFLDQRFGPNNSFVWNPNNDGSGSGLDADLLDGQHGSYYATATLVNNKVDRSGDTMTGFLTLSANPTSSLHAATKQYVDTKLALSGGNMTGPLILASDPSSGLQASTKQYTDSKVAISGSTMTGALILSGDPSSGLQAATKQYVDNATNPSNILANLLSVDGAGSGLDADLLDGQHGSYYTNIPARLGYTPVNKAGDTMTGGLQINNNLGVTGLAYFQTPGGSSTGGVIIRGTSNGNYSILQYVSPDNQTQWGQLTAYDSGDLYWGRLSGALGKIWHQQNQGSGSGMDADTVDGHHASDFITSSSFGSNSFGVYGYQVFPNGLIIQWGTDTNVGVKSFPIAFPNTCLTIVAGNKDSQGDRVDNAFAYVVNNSQYYSASKSSQANGISAYGLNWIAIGF